jgi:hypothetical protein
VASTGYLEIDSALALQGDLPVVEGSRGTSEPVVLHELRAVDAAVLARLSAGRSADTHSGLGGTFLLL